VLGFVSAHIQWNAISNLKLQQSFNALCRELVLLSASALGNIRRREYSLTVDAVKKQLSWGNKVSLTLNGWTSTNKLAISSVIAYCMDPNWALRDVQLAFDEVDSQFFFYFEWLLRLIGQGSTYWSNPSPTFEGDSVSFWAYQQPFTRNYDL